MVGILVNEDQEKSVEIFARDLIKGTMEALINSNEIIKDFRFLEIWTIIADESDHQQIKCGYTTYRRATILKFGSNEWALSFGVKSENRLGDLFNCDIAAIRITRDDKSDGRICTEICESLRENFFFSTSLFYVMANGEIRGTNKNALSKEIMEFIQLNNARSLTVEYLTGVIKTVLSR